MTRELIGRGRLCNRAGQGWVWGAWGLSLERPTPLHQLRALRPQDWGCASKGRAGAGGGVGARLLILDQFLWQRGGTEGIQEI